MRTLEHLSLKGINRQNAKTAPQGQFTRPAEPLSLKSVQERLFTKENCTPLMIRIVSKLVCSYGGEGETRTLAPVSRPTPLAGAPRHQLEYFSMVTVCYKVVFNLYGGESGIRTHGTRKDTTVFKTVPL